MENCYPVEFSGPGLLRELPDLFSKHAVKFDIDPKLSIDIECNYRNPMGCILDPIEVTCKIRGRYERGRCMQKFNLKKWTDSEIISSSIEELEQIYKAIHDCEIFIFVCGNTAEVVNGSKLNEAIIDGNITLSADLN